MNNMKTFGESPETNKKLDIPNILESVEIGAEKDKPRLEVSEFGSKQMESLNSSLIELKEDKEPKVVAIVRCWNKNEKDIKGLVDRIQRIKENIPGLQGVFLSINKEGDKGVTEDSLQKILATDSNLTVPIIPLIIEKYSWTAGLNSATAVLNEMCIKDEVPTENVRVMNLSFDVDLDSEELKKTDELIKTNDYVFTARETSEGDSPFEESKNKESQGDKLWEKFKDILRNPNSTDLSELSYSMRNTFNVIKLSNIVAMGGFNPMTNGESRKFSPASPNPAFFYNYDPKDVKVSIKGMEDAEFFMRLILGALKRGDISVLKEFRKSLSNLVLYKDESWNKLNELKKIRKISNEMTALSMIISGIATKEYKSTGQPGEKKVTGLVKDLYVPKQMQDFYLRK